MFPMGESWVEQPVCEFFASVVQQNRLDGVESGAHAPDRSFAASVAAAAMLEEEMRAGTSRVPHLRAPPAPPPPA
jgi:hypothetical protein